MSGRGRPIGSPIRDRVVGILYFLKEGYGYEIHKIYEVIFGPVAQKSIYYNLHKGVGTGDFELKEVKIEKGDFSWGGSVEKHIYKLGAIANPHIFDEVKEYFDNKK